jgi:hypothetical protein
MRKGRRFSVWSTPDGWTKWPGNVGCGFGTSIAWLGAILSVIAANPRGSGHLWLP